jgi:hypothetical protein
MTTVRVLAIIYLAQASVGIVLGVTYTLWLFW